MPNVIIIHGTGGSPKGNWFPWLKSELEKLNYKVFVPKFPTPKNQSLKNWLDVFKNYEQYLDKNAIVIGHSLGVAFLLTILEKVNHPIKFAFFVSGFLGLLNNPEFDELNKTFTAKSFDWGEIKSNCQKFYIINSDSDPYVPIEKGEDLAKKLNVKLTIIKNAGHINSESGYNKFELLLEKIKKSK